MTAPPDLLRLLAVPVFGWAALRDYRTRRVPNRTWYPPVALGAVALAWEAATLAAGTPARRRFLLAVAVSLGLVAPLGYGFYRLGGFGGADAKAFMAIAVLFPTYPLYRVGPLVFPQEIPAVGVFSLTILTDAVLVGLAYPVVLAARNAAAGRLSPAMFVGRPIRWSAATGAHGKLLESPSGFTLSGLDLDALRMYLRWRGASLADLRASPDVLRDPATLPDDPNPPTDGAVDPDGRIGVSDPENPTTDGGSAGPDPPPVRRSGDGVADPWGAEAFLEDVGSAYGTTPDSLRDGLDLLVTEDAVWISPGLPFLLPLFAGMLVALVYGDVLFALLRLAGLA